MASYSDLRLIIINKELLLPHHPSADYTYNHERRVVSAFESKVPSSEHRYDTHHESRTLSAFETGLTIGDILLIINDGHSRPLPHHWSVCSLIKKEDLKSSLNHYHGNQYHLITPLSQSLGSAMCRSGYSVREHSYNKL